MTRGRVLLVIGVLYLAQGLPFGFFTQALPVLMREAGYSLTAISVVGLLFAPWGVKFLWAPWVDGVGSRRRWVVASQLVAGGAALLLAGTGGIDTPAWLFVGVAVVNLASATQDIATDGWAVRTLDVGDRGLANGLQVGAYRVGMVVGGGLLLLVFDRVGWAATFTVLGALVLLCALPVLLLMRPAPTDLADAVGDGTTARARLLGWWTRLRRPHVVAFLLGIAVFKVGDSMGSALVGPFLVDEGLDVGTIALLKGVLASATVLVGAAVGGWLAWRVGRRATLLVGGTAQLVALVLLALAAAGPGGDALLVTAVLAESVLGGIGTVALFTVMMDAAEPSHAGTDYTLFASAVVGAQGLGALAGGLLGDLVGYVAVFGTAAVVALVGLVAFVRLLDAGRAPAVLLPVWRGGTGRGSGGGPGGPQTGGAGVTTPAAASAASISSREMPSR